MAKDIRNPNPEPVRCRECDGRMTPDQRRRAWPLMICDDCRLDEIARRQREATTANKEDA